MVVNLTKVTTTYGSVIHIEIIIGNDVDATFIITLNNTKSCSFLVLVWFSYKYVSLQTQLIQGFFMYIL